MRLNHGWRFVEGVLQKGTLRAMPTEPMAGLGAADPKFNPRTDAFAVRLGAVFEGPNRYRLGLRLMDREGACLDEDECPQCGTAWKDGRISGPDYRFRVRVPKHPSEPRQWESRYTYCRRCLTAEDLPDMAAAEAPRPAAQRRRT